MVKAITITLSPDVQQALDNASEQEGISRDEVVSRAIKEHVFLRKFRSLRERLREKATSEGIVTDQDVFDRVS